jgi:RHS repeat-associated protein
LLGLLCLVSGAVLAEEAATPVPIPIVDALASGRDTSAQAALALHALPKAAVRFRHPEGAMARFSAAIIELRDALRRAQRVGTSAALPQAQIDRLRAANLLVEAEFEARLSGKLGRSVAGIGGRLQSARQVWRAAAAPLLAGVDRLVGADSKERDAGRRDLLFLLEQRSIERSSGVNGAASLPVHRPRLIPRSPMLDINVPVSYATSGVEDLPRPEDLAAGVEALLSPAVLAQANALGNDYIAIADFVRTQIRTQWYAGSQKGADETLRTRAGNDIDQASLLIALLRASNAAARYVTGVVEVPAVDLARQLGVAESRLGVALAGSGIAHRPVLAQGSIAAYRLEHVWVSAHVPFGNYRGSSADDRSRSWIPLMPALKPALFEPAAAVLETTGLVVTDWIDGYLSQLSERSPWPALRDELTLQLAQQQPPLTLDGLRARHLSDAAPLSLLPASTPYPVIAVNLESAELLDDQRQWLRVVMRDGVSADDPVALSARFPLSEISSRRLGLGYLPATVEDQHLVNASGGVGGVPAYLIRVRPSIWLDGRPAATGTGEMQIGSAHRIELELSGPGGSVSADQMLMVGGVAALALDPQGDAADIDAERFSDSDPRSLRVLGRLAQRFQQDWSADDADIAATLGVSVIRPLPSATLAVGQYRINEVLGLANDLQFEGVALDALLRPQEPTSQRGDTSAEADWLRVSALQGSALEHRLFAEQWGVEALSADSGLQLAASGGVPLLHLQPGQDTEQLLPSHSASVRSHIAGWLDRGMDVVAPRDPLTAEAWSGSVWRVSNPATGESGYFLSGGYAGGVTIIPPDRWFFQDLAELLAHPYAGQPNSDPLAGFLVSLSAQAQRQSGIAGELLERPLLAYVSDELGRPVLGAPVEFSVRRGGGTLFGDSGSGESTVSVTDARGLASAQLQLAQVQAGSGNYFLMEGQQFPQWATTNEVAVSVNTAAGELTTDLPYIAHTFPAAPSQVELRLFGSAVVAPGLSYSTISVDVVDPFGNSVSNQAVSVSTADVRDPQECAADFSAAFGSSVFLPDQCPTDTGTIMFSNATCVSPTAALISQPGGAIVHVVPADTPATTTTVTATSPLGAAGASLQLRTNGELVSAREDPTALCQGPIYRALVQWYHGLRGYGANHANDRSFEAALPAARFAEHREFAVVAGFTNNFNIAMQWGRVAGFANLTGLAVSYEGANATDIRTNVPRLVTEYDLIAGPAPMAVNGQISIQEVLPQFFTGPLVQATPLAYVLDLPAPTVVPARVELSVFQRSTHDIQLVTGFSPASYRARSAVLELLEDGEVASSCGQILVSGAFTCRLGRGRYFDPAKRHSLRYSINQGSPFYMQSAETEIEFNRGIVVGFGADQSDKPLPGLNGFDMRSYPNQLFVEHEVDIATGHTCDVSSRFVFAIGRPAKISLSFYNLNFEGERSLIHSRPLQDQSFAAGVFDVPLRLSLLPVGEYEYELRAVADSDGAEEIYTGRATSQLIRRDSTTLAHSFVKGVDLFYGHALISSEDVAIGGRGPGLRFSRTYASHGGNEITSLGRGWNSDLDSQVLLDRCGTYIVTGSAGQGQRHIAAGQQSDGSTIYRPLSGYNGTLLRRADGSFDFYAKDGTRYHYPYSAGMGTRLSFIEDTNGNRVTYEYDTSGEFIEVSRMTDSAGRSLDLVYEQVTLREGTYGVPYELFAQRRLLTTIRGPLGLLIEYAYDENGNLESVQRRHAGGNAIKRERFEYADLGGRWVERPNGAGRYYQFGQRLVLAANDIDNSTRHYSYQLGWAGIEREEDVIYIPEQRVVELIEPDGGRTSYSYSGVRGLGPVSTMVRDARQSVTTYDLNRYGAAELVMDPAGTTTTIWNFTAQQPASITDALGVATEFSYDDFGNKVRERIVHAKGTLQRDWTYVLPELFDVPIKNRVQTYTDARRIETNTSWDERGNLLGSQRGGVTESYVVAANGDRISRTDGNLHSTHYRYDHYGHLIDERDALGVIGSATFDARGRQLSATNGNGNTTEYGYDELDRRVLTRHPAVPFGIGGIPQIGVSLTSYNDALRQRVDTDENGRSTTTSFDSMGRTLSINNALNDTRTFGYDFNGNQTSATDLRGSLTTMEYDAANRLVARHEPLGRSTTYTHDALGHMLSETTAERATEYRYEHPLYLNTHVRRRLGERWLQTVTAFDANGNAVATTDPRGHETARAFDDRDRLLTLNEPEGRFTEYSYDAADRRTGEALSGPLLTPQVRSWQYDQRGRETRRTDATGGHWVSAYDGAGNLLSRTDPLGHSVNLTYNSRNWLSSESGPVAGRTIQYGYDPVGNRIAERHANGREIAHGFDALNRLTDSTDVLGEFEPAQFSRTAYDADSNVIARTDGNGNQTTYVVDALNRVTTERRPLARILSWTHTIHGEVQTATDAEGATTVHEVDAMGRITKTIAPEPFLYETLFVHDDTNNVIEQTNARGLTTTWTFDGLNRRTTQTDPPLDLVSSALTQHWTHDAAGNVRSQLDRRGIETSMTYDGENRLLATQRDGLTKRTLTYDLAGNLATEADANGNLTTHTYNAANERIETRRPDDVIERWTYFPWGDLQSTTDADGVTTTRDYDLRRRLASETRPHGSSNAVTRHGYDGHGNRVATIRPLGPSHRWSFGFDAAHRLQSVDSPAAMPATYDYDLADRRTRITDAQSQATTTTLDSLGRPTRVAYANGNFETIDLYDGNGNVERRRDGNGNVIESTYDALDRLSTRSYVGSTQPADIISETWTYNPNGQPTRIEQLEASGIVHATQRSYDRQSRLDASTDRHDIATAHEYDAQDNRVARSDPEGRTVHQFDRLNRLRSVQPTDEPAIAIEYTPAGRIKTQVYPNGARADYTYDAAGRVETITHTQSGITTATLTYGYDANGNRESETHASPAGNRTTIYEYDLDDRLTRTEVTDETGTTTITDYTLDGVGNRLTERTTRGATLIANKTYHYNARHQLTQSSDNVTGISTTYAHDANGFMTNETTGGSSTTYRPNLQDRLATLTTPTGPPVNYSYDTDGLRVEKRSTVEATRYGYDGTQLRRETNVTNNPLATYDWSNGRVLRSHRGAQTSYAQHDALRSPIRWSLADGAEQGRATFDAWGVVTQQSGMVPPIGYTGYYNDQESESYYAQQRYYRAGIGRFNRIDPWAGDTNNPITLNKYLYANGNPLTYTDPDGRCGVAGLAVSGTWLGGICDAIDSRMIGTSDPAAIKEYRQGTGVGMVRTAVEGVVGTARTVADFHLAAYERLLGFDVGANDRLGATVAGGVEVASSPRLTTTDYIERNVNAFNEAKDSGNFAAAGEVTGSVSVDLNSVATGTAGLARGSVGLARRMGGAEAPRAQSSGPNSAELPESLNEPGPKIGAADASVALEDVSGGSAVAVNPRLTQRLDAWRSYQSNGGEMPLKAWVGATQRHYGGVSGGYRSGFQAWSHGQGSVHGNSLRATGPHDVYVIRDANTRQLLHFGETGRGYQTRFVEHQRDYAVDGTDISVDLLRTVEGKRAAKALERRYIRTYTKIFGQRPPENPVDH